MQMTSETNRCSQVRQSLNDTVGADLETHNGVAKTGCLEECCLADMPFKTERHSVGAVLPKGLPQRGRRLQRPRPSTRGFHGQMIGEQHSDVQFRSDVDEFPSQAPDDLSPQRQIVHPMAQMKVEAVDDHESDRVLVIRGE